jgi:hypothetical protein
MLSELIAPAAPVVLPMTRAVVRAGTGAIAVLTGVPSVGAGTQPPGTQGIITILGYAAWLVCALCVGGVFVVAGKMAVAHRHGIAGEHMTGLGFVLGACVLVAASSAIVGALV